jgi:hypothetical protein
LRASDPRHPHSRTWIFVSWIPEQKPHLIACDAGSTDFGPYYLGTGQSHKSPITLKRDLRLLLEGVLELGVRFITGSAGGAGGDAHVMVEAQRKRSPRITRAPPREDVLEDNWSIEALLTFPVRAHPYWVGSGSRNRLTKSVSRFQRSRRESPVMRWPWSG